MVTWRRRKIAPIFKGGTNHGRIRTAKRQVSPNRRERLGGVTEDIEQLKAEVAELKAALQGKAGVDDSNAFTKAQSFSGEQNQAAVIINSAKNNSIRFHRGNNENDYVQLFGHDNNLYLHAQSVPETKLLDSRDFPVMHQQDINDIVLQPQSVISIDRYMNYMLSPNIGIVLFYITPLTELLLDNTYYLFRVSRVAGFSPISFNLSNMQLSFMNEYNGSTALLHGKPAGNIATNKRLECTIIYAH